MNLYLTNIKRIYIINTVISYRFWFGGRRLGETFGLISRFSLRPGSTNLSPVFFSVLVVGSSFPTYILFDIKGNSPCNPFHHLIIIWGTFKSSLGYISNK